MTKTVIKARRKWYLPIKFWFTKRKERNGYETKTSEEIQKKIEEIGAKLITAEKNERFKEASLLQAQKEMLYWFIK